VASTRSIRFSLLASTRSHRNFLQRHRDLADQIDTAAGERQPAKEGLPPDHITVKSLQTELATAKHRNQEFSNRVQALER
jgi:hypothetical protein